MCKDKDEEEKDMATQGAVVKRPTFRKEKIEKALQEVELIQMGELPKKTARDFLKESRKE